MKKTGKFLVFLIAFVSCVCLAMQTSVFAVNAFTHYVRPDTEQTDIAPILKNPLTESDYELIFRQTGLTKTGVDRCLDRGGEGVDKILKIQKSYFNDYKIFTDYFAPFCAAQNINKSAEACYLEAGDILVTPCTQFSGVKIGHAAIVVDGGRVLSATRYGKRSGFSSVNGFTSRPAFAVLSPIADKEIKEKVAEYAENYLSGKRYGIFSGKNGCSSTQCAHLVWYAYNKFGIDLDGNGGRMVTPENILRSDKVEVVQIFGFDRNLKWI